MNLLRLSWLYFRIGAMNELQYRVNFVVQLFQSLIAVLTGLAGLWLVYSHTSTLGGWSSSELLVVLGVYTVMGGVINAVIEPNMERLMADIQQGTLDYALTKPEDAQVIVSVREIHIWQFVDVLVGMVILVIAVLRLQSHVGIGEALSFLLVLVLGVLMLYSFWLMLTTAAFWIVRVDEIVNLFQGVYAAGRYPVGIYPGWLRTGLTFLVPVAFAVTVPAEALTGRLTWQTVACAAALAAALLVLARWAWRAGLRRYSGASA
jgi:ABC-2 type transport system permease protein